MFMSHPLTPAALFVFSHRFSQKFKFVAAALNANKCKRIHYCAATVIVLILHLSSSRLFDGLSINPPETSDVVTPLFSGTVKHEVQPWDSPVPHCAIIVNFLTAWRRTTHITCFLTASPFESVHGWTIFNLSVSDHPPVAGPLAAHSLPPGQAGRIWYRAGSQITAQFTPQNIFRRCVARRPTMAPMPQCHSGGINYLPFMQRMSRPCSSHDGAGTFSQVVSYTGGKQELCFVWLEKKGSQNQEVQICQVSHQEKYSN